MSEITFVLTHGEAPKSMNAEGGGSRAHWSKAHKEKMYWRDIYFALFNVRRVPRGMEFCSVAATIRWRRPNHQDEINYLSSVIKPLADVMVEGGWLPDDTGEFIKFEGVTFEYPDEWDNPSPLSKAELVIRLTARYPE